MLSLSEFSQQVEYRSEFVIFICNLTINVTFQNEPVIIIFQFQYIAKSGKYIFFSWFNR